MRLPDFSSGFTGVACRRSACVPALAVAAFLAIPAASHAQTQCGGPDWEKCTLNVGGGWSPVVGQDSHNFNTGWNFQAGAGLIMTGGKPDAAWGWLVNGNFMIDQSAVNQTALQQAKILNPTNVGLLDATSASGKFYDTSLDLATFRFRLSDTVKLHVFGGFGWLHRSIDFKGPSSEGSLLQPGGPTVFGSGSNSGAFDAGAGINYRPKRGTAGLALYAEIRVVHGLTVNSATTLLPISAGIRW